MVDNRAAIVVANHPVSTQQSRHINLREFRVREFQEQKVIRVYWCPSEANLSDGMTKLLPRESFIRLKKLIGVSVDGSSDLCKFMTNYSLHAYDATPHIWYLDETEKNLLTYSQQEFCYYLDE